MTIGIAPESNSGPEPGECLRCYLIRMIRAHGCDNTRKWTLRWRDQRAPGDSQLMEQLEERGGICCDCEVVFNVWQQADQADRDNSRDEGNDLSPRTGCAGTDLREPLALCPRWHGWEASDPFE